MSPTSNRSIPCPAGVETGGHKRGQEAREARRSQREIALARLVARALERHHRLMPHAINGKDHDIGAAHESGEKRRIVLKPAVVVKEAAVDLLDQSA